MISTIFKNNISTEVERIAFTCSLAAKGFYNEQNFILTDEILTHSMQKITLPHINYQEIENFWTRIKKVKQEFPVKIPDDINEQLTKLLTSQYSKIKIQPLQNNWETKKEEFWQFVKFCFPNQFQEIKEVEIRLTNFGSGCSFSLHQNQSLRKIIVYWRQDMDVAHLAESILSAIFSATINKHSSNWLEAESSVDLLMTSSRLSKIFPNYQPTLQILNTEEFIQQSNDDFLKKIGCPIRQTSFDFHKGLLTINGKPACSFLSKQETLLFELFIKSPNQVVDYDSIASVLWNNESEFSLWAINRTLSRLRKKLSQKNINFNLKTIRNQGYCWLTQ